jgi:hypothetical protein
MKKAHSQSDFAPENIFMEKTPIVQVMCDYNCSLNYKGKISIHGNLF